MQALRNDKLKSYRIWLWPESDIEDQLTVSDKNSPTRWDAFLCDLEQQPLETLVSHHARVQSLIAWLQSQPEDAEAARSTAVFGCVSREASCGDSVASQIVKHESKPVQ